MLPTVTFPKLRVAGLEARAPGVTPVPVSGMVRVGFDELEVTVRLPLALPEATGLKLTLKLTLCPAVSVTGAVIPLTLNPVPLLPICEIVTVEPPVFVSFSETD